MSEPVIPEALIEELIDAAIDAYGGSVSVSVSNRPMKYADVYRAQMTAALTAVLAWRDESGPFLYTRDQLEQVGHVQGDGSPHATTEACDDPRTTCVAVYRLRENRQ